MDNNQETNSYMGHNTNPLEHFQTNASSPSTNPLQMDSKKLMVLTILILIPKHMWHLTPQHPPKGHTPLKVTTYITIPFFPPLAPQVIKQSPRLQKHQQVMPQYTTFNTWTLINIQKSLEMHPFHHLLVIHINNHTPTLPQIALLLPAHENTQPTRMAKLTHETTGTKAHIAQKAIMDDVHSYYLRGFRAFDLLTDIGEVPNPWALI